MFYEGKHRYLRSEVYKQGKFNDLPDITLLLLIALRSWADDDGNVDLTLEEFVKKADRWRKTPIDLLYESAGELIQEGHLHAYIVEDRYYASIEGFNDIAAPLYSPKPRSEKDKTKWRNPTPEEGEPVDSIGDASGSSVVSRMRRDDGDSERPRGSSGTRGGAVEPRTGQASPGLRGEGKAVRKRLPRKRVEASKAPEPRSPMQKTLKKPQRPLQRAEEVSPEDLEAVFDIQSKLNRLKSQWDTN